MPCAPSLRLRRHDPGRKTRGCKTWGCTSAGVLRMTPLALHQVLAVDADGTPVLAGVNAQVVATQAFAPSAVGQMAVCQMAAGPGGLVLAFGLLPGDTPADAGPLELRCGKAALVLAADGSIRLSGGDVVLASTGRLRLDGAVIDLN